jgi:hypothetical protein
MNCWNTHARTHAHMRNTCSMLHSTTSLLSDCRFMHSSEFWSGISSTFGHCPHVNHVIHIIMIVRLIVVSTVILRCEHSWNGYARYIKVLISFHFLLWNLCMFTSFDDFCSKLYSVCVCVCRCCHTVQGSCLTVEGSVWAVWTTQPKSPCISHQNPGDLY